MIKPAIRRHRRVYCPHCTVYVGMLQGGLLNVGLVLLGTQTVTLTCLKCSGEFIYHGNAGAPDKADADPDLALSPGSEPEPIPAV